MKSPSLLLVVTLIFTSAAHADSASNSSATVAASGAPASQAVHSESGFTPLYNEKDLTGWSYSPTEIFDGKTDTTDGRFSAKTGSLVVNPQKEGGPRFGKIWTTKEFPKDFELRLEFRASVNADSGIYLRGKQLQCRDYLVAGPYKTLTKYKAQDWNEVIVVVKNGVANCTCNGEVLEAALALPATGPIGFEADRGQMEYRHIRIREL